MKILVLTSRFPYPLEKGDKLRIYHQIKGLSVEHEIVLVSLNDTQVSEAHLNELRPYCSAIHMFRLRKWMIYPRVVRWFLGGRSIQIGYFTNYFLKIKIRNLVLKEKPDHIYCQLIRMAEYVKDLHHITKSLDYMDAFSLGMERRAQDSPFPLKHIFKAEAKRLRDYESKVFYDFDVTTIISKQDRKCIKNPFEERIVVVPNGVDTQEFFFKENLEPSVDLLFVGNMSYYPNIKAAEYLVEHVFATLVKHGIKVTVDVAGANPSLTVQALEAEHVQISGWVDNIVTTYHSARVFVAPLFHGSGLQNKILEAMACGIPVVTTKQTNNAIGATEGKDLLIAETAEEFSLAIQRLLNDKTIYDALRRNARNFVEQKYSWDVSVSMLDNAIKSIE